MSLLLTGCSPYALVNSETYNGANLSDYHTFRIVTPDMGSLPKGMGMVTYYNIAAAVREQMEERGFTETPDSPILINFAITTQRGITTAPLAAVAPPPPPPPVMPPGYFPYHGPYYPYYIWPRMNYGPYWNPALANTQVITGVYKEGTLTMDIVNTQTRVPVFSASVATIINGPGNGYQSLQGITEAVATLFSKFPVPIVHPASGK